MLTTWETGPPQEPPHEGQHLWKPYKAQPGVLPGNASLSPQRQAAEPHWIEHFLALLFPQYFCIRWSHSCPHLWQHYPALSHSMHLREGAQTNLNMKALIFTQCDTDPAQRTLLLRYAGRTLISLICSPSSLFWPRGQKWHDFLVVSKATLVGFHWTRK